MNLNKNEEKKNFKMADSKAEQFLPKFHRMILGIVGLIDAKGNNVIWPSGCLT